MADQITVEAARRGDRTAQAALLRELQDPWFRFCLSLLGDPDNARDAVQETALRFLRDLSKFRGNSTLMTWSMGIALNVTRELRRKSKPALRLAGGDSDDDDFPGVQAPMDHKVEAPPEQAAGEETREKIRALLGELPERQREAVLLRYFEELSVEETATAMNCAVGTVKATVFQALRALRLKLE